MAPAAPDLTLVELDGGGLLLNLRTGVVFQLNASAALVWRRLLAGDERAAITRALAARYGLEPGVAERDVAAAEAMDVAVPASYPRLDTEFNYERDATGYVFSFLGTARLRVDEHGNEISPAGPSAPPPPEFLSFLLMAIVPKLAALRGGTVLHASAFLGDAGDVTAISGESGAGKTTTVRAVATAGARLVSEDKLVLASDERVSHVMLEGESRLLGWAARAAREIEDAGHASCRAIDEALREGPTAPLGSILFIDARQRGLRLDARRLDQTSGAAMILHSAFFGSDLDDDWRLVLARSAALGRAVSAFQAVMPEGLPFSRKAAEALARGTFRSR